MNKHKQLELMLAIRRRLEKKEPNTQTRAAMEEARAMRKTRSDR